MKETITQVSITSDRPRANPIYNCITVGPNDEAAGSFLKITGEDEVNEGASLHLDWEEWDALVKVVARYRQDWEWGVQDEQSI